MLSCREVTELLSQAQERPLGFFEHAGVRLHLLICRGCTNFRRQLDFTTRLVSDVPVKTLSYARETGAMFRARDLVLADLEGLNE